MVSHLSHSIPCKHPLISPSGNPLGTRYKPCKTAAEGIFSGRPRTPAGPVHPEGPRYWHTHPRRTAPTSSHFYVYTFFAASVTPSPAYAFPPRLAHHHQPSVPPPQPLYQPPPLDAEAPPFDSMVFDRGVTASPTPLSDVGEGDAEGEGYAYQYPSQSSDPYPYQPVPGTVGEQYDPDGEFIAEPSSPDKTGDVMLLPDR